MAGVWVLPAQKKKRKKKKKSPEHSLVIVVRVDRARRRRALSRQGTARTFANERVAWSLLRVGPPSHPVADRGGAPCSSSRRPRTSPSDYAAAVLASRMRWVLLNTAQIGPRPSRSPVGKCLASRSKEVTGIGPRGERGHGGDMGTGGVGSREMPGTRRAGRKHEGPPNGLSGETGTWCVRSSAIVPPDPCLCVSA
jgi:hypothetical protein